MEKSKINVRELVNKYQVDCERIKQIADVCEKEQRERNKEESVEFDAIVRKCVCRRRQLNL